MALTVQGHDAFRATYCSCGSACQRSVPPSGFMFGAAPNKKYRTENVLTSYYDIKYSEIYFSVGKGYGEIHNTQMSLNLGFESTKYK